MGGAPSGGSAGDENCFDKKDNDENGFVDCGDPACQKAGYTCQKSPPAGWQGYFHTSGDPFDTTNTPPSCPDGSPPLKYRANPVDASCTPCSCGALTGTTCGPPHLLCTTGSTSCIGATDWTSKFQSCTQVGSPSTLSCRMTPVAATSPGTCTPSGGKLADTALFGRWLYVCGAPRTTGGGCIQGQSCAAPGSGAYSGAVCIRQTGEHACPTGWSTQQVGYENGTDTRSCSACSCAPVASSVTCTTGAFTFYDHNDCTCKWHAVCHSEKQVNSANCVDVSNLLDKNLFNNPDWGGKYTAAPAPNGGTCTPSGGQPSGSVQTTGAVTYCCL